MDDLFDINGSTLIVTTWNWEVMKYCSIKVCKVNVKELNEEMSQRMYHLFLWIQRQVAWWTCWNWQKDNKRM